MPTHAPLAITMGDPAGCGPQITAKAWHARREIGLQPFFVVSDPSVFLDLCPIVEITHPNDTFAHSENTLPVLSRASLKLDKVRAGSPNPNNAGAIIHSIEQATALALTGDASGVVTNPISKAVLYEAGFKHPGHTEFIAELCDTFTGTAKVTPIMMLSGGGLRVALATIHIPLMQVSEAITPDRLKAIAQIVNTALRKDYGITSPRVAFTGLNPHAGEDGAIGTEEQMVINPTAAELREAGINITNARSADTVFHEALNGDYDAVIAMTHDQGLIPVKTLDMWGGVNTTLGLPIVRTSPDHGTAYDAAASGTCRADSLIAAIKHAEMVVQYRSNHE